MAAVLGLPSPDCTGPTRVMILVQRSPWLGELVVTVGRVSGREEDHIIAVAKGHELQAPKPDHRGQQKWTFGVSHPEKWQENDVNTQLPYLVRQLSASGPGRPISRQVNLCCVFPNPNDDAKRIRGGLSWFGQRRPYVQREREGIVFPCT
jgi:hypothetical protein